MMPAQVDVKLEPKPRLERTAVEYAALVAPYMLPDLETLVVVYVDAANQIIGEPHVVATGGYNHVEVDVMDVFGEAARRFAAGIVITHNHPSGDPTPSLQDINMTAKVAIQAMKYHQLKVIDHVVVGGRYCTSIRSFQRAIWNSEDT